MCLKDESDKVPDGVHNASTSSETLKTAKDLGGLRRPSLPAMAAAAAIASRFVDVRQMPEVE